MAFIGQDRAEFNLKRQQAQAQYQLGQGLLKMMGQQGGQPQAGQRPAAPQIPPAQPGGKAPGSEWQNPPGSPGFVGPPAPQQAPQVDPRRQGPNGMTLNPATGLPMGWMPGQPTTGFNGPMMDRAQQSVGTYNQSQQTALANEQTGVAQQNAQTQAAWNAQPHPYAGMAEVTPQQYAQFQQQNTAAAGQFPLQPGMNDFETQQWMRGQMGQYQQQQNNPAMLAGIRAEQAGPGLKAFPVRETGYGMLPMPQMEQGQGGLVPPTAQQAISPQIPGADLINGVYSMLQNGIESAPQDVQSWMSAQGQPPQAASWQSDTSQMPPAPLPSSLSPEAMAARPQPPPGNFAQSPTPAVSQFQSLMQMFSQIGANAPRENPLQREVRTNENLPVGPAEFPRNGSGAPFDVAAALKRILFGDSNPLYDEYRSGNNIVMANPFPQMNKPEKANNEAMPEFRVNPYEGTRGTNYKNKKTTK